MDFILKKGVEIMSLVRVMCDIWGIEGLSMSV